LQIFQFFSHVIITCKFLDTSIKSFFLRKRECDSILSKIKNLALRVIYFINSLIRLTIVETRTYDSAIVVPQNFCQRRISRGRIHVHMRACIAGVLATDAHASTFRQFIYTNGQKAAAEINIGLYYSQNKIREELNS